MRGGTAENPHTVAVPSGDNVRELGGFPLREGGCTRAHRFVRSGTTSTLTRRDLFRLRRYGIKRVLDLRGEGELRVSPDPFARRRDVVYLNVPMYNFDLHDPKLVQKVDEDTGLEDYLISGYLDMLANRPALAQIFSFFAQATPTECVLFHCTAGMDRTGVISMLVLALAGVDRSHLIADYTYSYADEAVVNRLIFDAHAHRSCSGCDGMNRQGDAEGSGDTGCSDSSNKHRDEYASSDDSVVQGLNVEEDVLYQEMLRIAPRVMGTVYDRLCAVYEDVPSYLQLCGVSATELDAVRAHLMA